MEARIARVTTETKLVEQPLAPQPQPQSRLPIVTVESPVVQPVIEPVIKHSRTVIETPIQQDHAAASFFEAAPYFRQTIKKPVNWIAWAIGLALLIVIGEVIWVLVS